MRRLPLLLLFLFISQLVFSQIKGIVVDAQSKKAIPYVNIWIENKEIGVTSDENGAFLLNTTDSTATIVFSVIGYETKKLKAKNIGEFIPLDARITLLNEVFVSAETKERTIGNVKKRNIHGYHGCIDSYPHSIVWFQGFKEEYIDTPFLKTIRFLTKSNIKKATFSVTFYAINDEDGAPGDVLHKNTIIATARKGKKITEIDLSDYHIQFPENGIFISYDFLALESNQYQLIYYDPVNEIHIDAISYEPRFALESYDNPFNVWRLRDGKWYSLINKFSADEEYYRPIIQLVLTN